MVKTEVQKTVRARGDTSSVGFTLIEIMVALAILGTALFMLLETHYSALRLFEKSQDKVREEEMMTRAVGMAELEVRAGNMTGSFDMGKRYPDWSFTFDATPYSDNVPTLYRLSVTLIQSNRNISREEVEYLFLPRILPQGQDDAGAAAEKRP